MTASNHYAVAARSVFDGDSVRKDAAVIIDGELIVDVRPRGELPAKLQVQTLGDDAWLAPGFIDIQVNGGGDVLFNDEPTPEGVDAIARAHRRYGTTGLLPTLISDTPDKMRAALAAVQQAAAENQSILGIHFEGPFLSTEKPGVHDPSMFRCPDQRDIDLLTSWPAGSVLVTLAPECVPEAFIATLVRAGVRVALGHTAASYEQAKAAFAQGATGVTHLFNAMLPLASRAPGPISAALETPGVWFGMIVDGEHVAPAMLQLVLRGCVAHPVLVTDAMPPVGGRNSRFLINGREVLVRDGRCTRADGTLAGSALDMASAVRNAVGMLGVPLTDALRFASAEPAEFLGLGHNLGRLAPRFRADMVALDPAQVRVLETWVAGRATRLVGCASI
jgi:N-acetylglucosamine-6-phosphate deacetylase